jgi:hypothetical protein
MRRTWFFALGVTLAWVATAQAQTSPPQKEHAWLQQLAGEWLSQMESVPQPGQPEMKCEGTISAQMLGELWVVSQMKADMMGMPMQAIKTIGYDEKTKKYVGTWVDSMQNHMWKYEGSVDPTGKVLTLEAEGPNMMQPGKMARYRDVYEFKSKDHYTMSSQMQFDGKWVTFMNGNVRRIKK